MTLVPKKMSQEIFLSDVESSQAVSKLLKKGEVRKIGPRLYTTNLIEPPETIIARNIWIVVGLLAPNTVIGWRTAFTSNPSIDKTVFLTGPYKREIDLPGMRIVVMKGSGPLDGDMPFVGGLYMASEARCLLENLMPTKAKGGVTRSVSRSEIEDRLTKSLHIRGEEKINVLRDHARAIAPSLGAEKQFEVLSSVLSTLMRTGKIRLKSSFAVALAAGEPYDADCVQRFEVLRRSLATEVLPFLPKGNLPPAFYNESFFDAYFSNYIEGTDFPVDEALDIVFKGVIPVGRPADAHDVIGTYRVLGDFKEIFKTPSSLDEFVGMLKQRHATIISGRPDKRPGEFKELNNQAGSSVFVHPDLVLGTLKRGFDLYKSLEIGLARALFMMFMVSEIHPFDDGNGRVSRVMMNAELLAGGLCRIIIPSVFRDEYILSLKRLKNHSQPESYLRVMVYAQDFVNRIDFSDLQAAKAMLQQCNAFEEPGSGKKLSMPLVLDA